MATEVLNIVDLTGDDDAAAADDDDDDEVMVLSEKPATRNKGTSKLDAISVENYHSVKPKNFVDLSQHLKHKFIIDLSQTSSNSDDNDLIVLSSSSNCKGNTLLKGESSNSKSGVSFNRIPLKSVCEICMDEKFRTDMFRILGCSHYYCRSCIEKYIVSKLHENETAINYPVSSCVGILEPYHCRRILPEQVFERWGDALCEAAILGAEKFYCPYKNCSAMLLNDNIYGDEAIVQCECPDCNRSFCAQCNVPWHLGIKCEDFQKLNKDERTNEDIMLMNLAKSKEWKRCPVCRFSVERTEGCLLMMCRCKHSFCYNCGALMKEHYCHNCKH